MTQEEPPPPAGPGAGTRSRLLDAMKRVAAAEGYAAASVARVSAAAGVSRVTFYERFENREECFLACCREVMAGFYERVSAAVEAAPEPTSPAVLKAFLNEVQADPAAARLILLEALGGPDSSRSEYEKLIDLLAALAQDPSEHGFGRPARWISATSLLGAVVVVASIRLSLGRVDELRSLADEVAAWADAYAVVSAESPPDRKLWEGLGRRLFVCGGPKLHPVPNGEGGSRSRRDRLVEATAQVTARRGFADLRVADVVATAGVQRGAFYGEFRDKRDAFQAVQVLNLQRSIAAAAEQFSLGGTWPERVWRGLAALHSYLARHPEETYLALVEVYAAGEEAIRLAQHSRGAFSLFLEEGYRQGAALGLPTLCLEAIGAAIYFSMRRMVARREAQRLPELLPQSAFIALAPFIGPSEALAFVRFKVREAGRGSRTARPGLAALPGREETGLVAGPA
jgi:AcrR family transcriptional regulator